MPETRGLQGLGGGRTRARTWDPLIKSQRANFCCLHLHAIGLLDCSVLRGGAQIAVRKQVASDADLTGRGSGRSCVRTLRKLTATILLPNSVARAGIDWNRAERLGKIL